MLDLLFKKHCWNGGSGDSSSLAESNMSSGIGGNSFDDSKYSSKQAQLLKSLSSDGSLKQSDVQLRLVMHHGLSASCCRIAYDPLQHVLAMATKEGYIKVFNNEGIERFLQSSRQCAIQFLQFVNNQNVLICANTENVIEVWDTSSSSLIGSQQWNLTITSLTVIQESAYFYIGDASGTVTVFQHDRERLELTATSYAVSLPQVLGVLSTNYEGLCVKNILPQPSAEHERVLLCYGNGICALWALHDGEVLSIRVHAPTELDQLSNYGNHTFQPHPGDQNGECKNQDIKQFTCACWCCERGITFATGYSDGEIWLWSIAQPPSKSLSTEEQLSSKYSSTPMRKIKTGFSVSINILKWWEKGGRKQDKERLLCVLGGKDAAANDVFKVISLNSSCLSRPEHYVELEVLSPLADFLLAQNMTIFSLEAECRIMALGTDGKLYTYKEKPVLESLKLSSHSKNAPLIRPVPFENTFSKSKVTSTKLILLKRCGHVSDLLLKAPRIFKPGLFNLSETSVSFGCKQTDMEVEGCYLYFTGHENGFVHVWDLSSQIAAVCSLQPQTSRQHDGLPLVGSSPVTSLDFCFIIGLLTVGYANGFISLFELILDNHDANITKHSHEGETRESIHWSTGSTFYTHQAPISCIVISALWHHVAVGCENGRISLIDIKAKTILYSNNLHEKHSSIISLHFANVTTQQNHMIFRALSCLKVKHYARMRTERLFVATKDSEVLILDSQSHGSFKTTMKIRNPGNAISMHILDASDASLLTPAGLHSQLISEETYQELPAFENFVKETTMTLEMAQDAHRLEYTVSGKASRKGNQSTQYLLLLCSEDALQAYRMPSLSKDVGSSFFKLKFHCSCQWATTFQTPNQKTGFAIFYKTGRLELRCLPSLNVLKSIPIEGFLHWKTEPDLTSLRHISCTLNGRIAVVKDDGELRVLSVLDMKHDFSSSKLLAVKQIAAKKGTEVSSGNIKKRTLGKVIKATNVLLKVSDKGKKLSCQTAVDLDLLFTGKSSSFSVSFPSTHLPNDESPSGCSSLMDISSNSLDIDDIELDDEDFSTEDGSKTPSCQKSSTKVQKTMRKKEKLGKLDSNKIKLHELEAANQTPKSDVDFSRVHGPRSIDEIKAAYGQGKEHNITGAAVGLRDKIIQQRRKIQAIDKKTADMQEGAQRFHTMAEELLRTMEEKNRRKFF